MGIIIQRNIQRRVKHYSYQVEPVIPEVGIADSTGSG